MSPLFVIGNARSGTSLLRLMLTSHEKIVVPPECGFLLWLADLYQDWKQTDCYSESVRSRFIDDLMAAKKFETWGLRRQDIDAEILKNSPVDYAHLCAQIYLAYARSKGKSEPQIWGDKNNYYINHLPRLIELYPQARFLHIVRDGRDVACSYREVMAACFQGDYVPKFSSDIQDIAKQWSANVLAVRDFFSQLSERSTYLVRYEDLVHSPEQELTAICQYLEIEYDQNMSNFYQSNHENELEPIVTRGWKKRTLEPASDATVGRYQRLMSTAEKAHFERIAKTALQSFNYVF